MSKFRTLTIDELAALQRFAKAHGRRWKMRLATEYWYNARILRGPGPSEYADDGYVLHGLRNCPNWGHDGLAAFRLARQPDVSQ